MHGNQPAAVGIGSRILLSDSEGSEEYLLAPEEEVDAAAGRISATSPVGRAVLGHNAGERLSIRTPGGVRTVTIASVS